ncbi:MAG: DUF89 family protein [Clostridia bacterium]|nr:DUF89 family protein [Clostridia bacterium]MBR5111723.1 DUF89 family protein [Clostridia bacterium]
MRISESCAKCLYDRQRKRMPDEGYLSEVRALINSRGENDTSPLLVYRFNQAFARRFGASDGYAEVKRRYNDLVLAMEDKLRSRIAAAADPLATALAFSRLGNYIDYGAMDTVDEGTFLGLFERDTLRAEEAEVYGRFVSACEKGSRFLLIADNCGEIVLDRLLLEQVKLRFPRMRFQVLVRGGEVLNDVTMRDAAYVGIDRVAQVLPNGAPIAGTVYDLLPEAARRALDTADVVLAKGQGNYESLSGQGRHVFYAFLCKCDLFTTRFGVPPLTGMLVEETA